MVDRQRFGGKSSDKDSSAEKYWVNRALDLQDLWPYDYGDKEIHFMDIAKKVVEGHFGSEKADKPPYMIPTSSGTSSIQVALGGLQIPAGSEVIVTPITDPGTVSPILFHNAIPVFSDVDPASGLMTAETIKAVITNRTKAIIVVHLTGSPVDVPSIKRMLDAEKRTDIKIIEDVAQGLGASLNGVPLGMLGDAGCFSLNSQKHITVGEGGFVLVQDSESYYRCHNFSDKHRARFGRTENTEHHRYQSIGHSLRMSELQGAMLMGQMPRLNGFAKARYEFGSALDRLLSAETKLVPQEHLEGAYPTYFFHMLAFPEELSDDPERAVKEKLRIKSEVGKFLKQKSPLAFWSSYNQSDLPIYKYPVFQTKNFFPNASFWPAALLAEKETAGEITTDSYSYKTLQLDRAESYLRRSFRIAKLHEGFEPEHARVVVDALKAGFRAAGHPID